ncbi:MAG TPA: non-ribosomal peptide synthetase [Steroidobacteraceae bacterium]|nr:non-ribosomal peptide synthetase [Steroidobacteraceae bacterium]
MLTSLPQAFSAIAGRYPDRIALTGDTVLTYAQLEARSNAIAGWLRSRGIGLGNTVGLYAHRSAEAIAAMLGILKCGAAYVPFDTSYPSKLLRYLYEDSAPSAMLVQEALLQGDPATEVFWTGAALSLGAGEPQPGGGGAEIGCVIPGDAVAYVMYTSGSTGRPKGVVVPHRAVLRLVIDNDYVELGPDQVILQLAPLSFDASTFEIWGALLHGGTLAIVSNPHPTLEDIGQAIARLGVTTLWLTAGLFHLMVDHRLADLAPARQLLAGGDVLSPSHVLKALRALPGCRLINGYGPTENTTFSCCYTVPRDFDGTTPIPIGPPIRHTDAHVLDEALRPVADGMEGELFLGGIGLAKGYLNRPELTAERFIPSPFDPTGAARLYRTGDRVRRDRHGDIHFLGRADRQVKINGKRVELDEIETCLRRSNLVRDAAVICLTAATGQKQIAAFVTALPGAPVAVAEVRGFLRGELPDYMIPTLTVLDALPLAPTGKVDRARLPAVAAPAAPAPLREPAGAIETALLGIWRQVLGNESVGLDDNFFDLGGSSLQLLEVHATIKRTLPWELSVIDMFQYPRISALARHLAAQETAAAGPLSAQDRASRQRAALARRRSPQSTV